MLSLTSLNLKPINLPHNIDINNLPHAIESQGICSLFLWSQNKNPERSILLLFF